LIGANYSRPPQESLPGHEKGMLSYLMRKISVLFRFAFDIIVFAIAVCIPLLAGAVTL